MNNTGDDSNGKAQSISCVRWFTDLRCSRSLTIVKVKRETERTSMVYGVMRLMEVTRERETTSVIYKIWMSRRMGTKKMTVPTLASVIRLRSRRCFGVVTFKDEAMVVVAVKEAVDTEAMVVTEAVDREEAMTVDHPLFWF
ncbi:hypothetical protein L6452_30667 [Arctium lappa]|uniref:Uncharacterized protein n=1 Tax=Arctium lappa TaxID=4217 RepID=A0ACB8ZHY0_ARCLA|nr:hypothetical protein L6452_30667 [Arctium lappa]